PLAGLEPGFRNYVASRQATGVYRGYGARLLETGDSPLRPLVVLRRDLTDRLRRVLPGDLGALAAGIVTGDDSALSDETANAFQVSGLSHITAVSGQNIAILAGLVTLLFRGQAVRRLIIIQIATLLVVWLYVGVTGFGAPAIRAGLFVTCAVAASRLGRRPDFLTILALVSGGMLLANPAYRASVSFWLSMAASAALVTFIGVPSGGIRMWVVRTGGALAAAQLATVPIAIAVFGTWSLGSVPANLIVGPVMELAFPICFLLAACVYLLPIAAPVIAVLAEGPLALSIGTARGVAFLFPQTDLAAGGVLVVLAAALPCLALICLLSEDMRRWGRRLERAFVDDRARIGATGAGVVVGTAVAMLALAMLMH
ncbi:MAG: ComEC/Rec2 family competence protein, partial [Thermomicrobiales bacterium]